MNNTPILYDSHMHTPLCKHAHGQPEEYAAAAEQHGLKGIIFTCHNPGPDGWSTRVRMSLDQLDEYVAMVARAREAWHGRIDVRLGLESDYFPGMESFLEALHQRADFNHILGSVHPQLPYYREVYDTGNAADYFQTYFNHLADAAESGLFDTLSHPDLVKNVYPHEWQVESVMNSVKKALDRIAKTGTAMELNTSGLNKRVKEMNPGQEILAEMQRRDIPVVLGSDSHEPGRVAADFEQALVLLQDVGYTAVHVYLNRQRHSIPITNAAASLITPYS
ncbi:MAG: histidinol-phosphatase HisJ family protein [Ardenticatenaceae bacterium]|nr:histidinol-phosphatase HisJ family protein [Ardenticatenaceae bacterium]MCB9446382.1 histidinol-phosphatase HisJ family protein [Ardenticatenaceae bacterium]